MSENADRVAERLEQAYELESEFRGLSLPCDKYDLNPRWFRSRFKAVKADRSASKLTAKRPLVLDVVTTLESYDGDPSIVNRLMDRQGATSQERDEQTSNCAKNIRRAYSNLVNEVESEQPAET